MCLRKMLMIVFLFSLVGISGSYAQKIQLESNAYNFFKTKKLLINDFMVNIIE